MAIGWAVEYVVSALIFDDFDDVVADVDVAVDDEPAPLAAGVNDGDVSITVGIVLGVVGMYYMLLKKNDFKGRRRNKKSLWNKVNHS